MATVRAPVCPDALQRRVLDELSVFTAWLHRFGVDGCVGEVGWPGRPAAEAARWNDLAERWFDQADRAGLWVVVWATGERWRLGHRLTTYEARPPGGPVSSPGRQAPVIERHPGVGGVRRGVTDAGGEFGTPATDRSSDFSNENPGRYGVEYGFDSRATFDHLASRGLRLVRIPFRWERLQRRPGEPLDRAELGRLRAAVRRAGRAGLEVVLDLHNYGAYYLFDGRRGVRRPLGSAELPIGRFADLWRRISGAFRDDSAVVGHGLMNEPVGLASAHTVPPSEVWPSEVWRRASQAAVEAIRGTGDTRMVLVCGSGWSGAQDWPRCNPRPWIADPAGNVRYEAHHYWDLDHSGSYRRTYEEELSALRHSRGT